jgi:hypothetical protein
MAEIERQLDEMLAGDLSPTMRLEALAERRRAIESRARVLGPITSEPVSYRDLAGWPEFEAAILGVLDKYPTAPGRAPVVEEVSRAVAALE